MEKTICPKCGGSDAIVKSGFVNGRQRHLCKNCNYYFSVNKIGKTIDNYYMVKAFQLYLEGLSLREIERILGVSHSTISNWVKEFNIKKPNLSNYDPKYKILTFSEMKEYLSQEENYKGNGIMITELGNKYLVIKWVKTT